MINFSLDLPSKCMKFSSEIVVKVLITLSAPHLRQPLWATVHALHLIIDPANTGPDPLFDDRLFAGPVGEEIDHLADDNRGLGFGAAVDEDQVVV